MGLVGGPSLLPSLRAVLLGIGAGHAVGREAPGSAQAAVFHGTKGCEGKLGEATSPKEAKVALKSYIYILA